MKSNSTWVVASVLLATLNFASGCASEAAPSSASEEAAPSLSSEADALRRKTTVGTWRSDTIQPYGRTPIVRAELSAYADRSFTLTYATCSSFELDSCVALPLEEASKLEIPGYQRIAPPMQGRWRMGLRVEFLWGILETGPYSGFGPRILRPAVFKGRTTDDTKASMRLFETSEESDSSLYAVSTMSKDSSDTMYTPVFRKISDTPNEAFHSAD